MEDITPRASPPAAPSPAVSLARSLFPGLLTAVLLAVGVVVVEGTMAHFTGSYLPLAVVGTVSAFWAAAALLAALAAWTLLLPLILFLKGLGRRAVLPAVVVGAGFYLSAYLAGQTFGDADPLGGEILLSDYLLFVWAALFGIFGGVLIARSRRMGSWSAAALLSASTVFCAGAAYFGWKTASAFTLVVGPFALVALGGAALESLAAAWKRAALTAGIVAALALALAVLGAGAGEKPLAPIDRGFEADPGKIAMLAGKPNVIVVVLDTVRADHTSICGYEHPTTPNLEKLLPDCRFFPNGESVDSWTLPAHASLFTGKYPREHGAHADTSRGVESVEKWRPFGIPLAPSQLTLASCLSMKGYKTGAFVANYSWLCRQYGVDQGFAYYYDLPRVLLFTEGGSPAYKYGMEAADRLLGLNGKTLQPYWDAESVTMMAIDWLDDSGDTPFFLFLNYMDPHYPYAAPPPFDEVSRSGVPYDMRLRQRPWQELITQYINTGNGLPPDLLQSTLAQYDGAIAYTDYWIGALVDYLKKRRLYEDTLLVITSDHGEFFGEHQLLNHGVGLYEGGLRIPILVKYPGGRFAGERGAERVSIIDIFATVFEVLQLPMPPASAVPLGGAARPIYAEDYENGMNVKRYGDRFKGIRSAVYDVEMKLMVSTTAPKELYDLKTDPGEAENLVSSHTEVSERMGVQVSRWQETTPHFDGTKETARRMSATEIERLKSLGYIGAGR